MCSRDGSRLPARASVPGTHSAVCLRAVGVNGKGVTFTHSAVCLRALGVNRAYDSMHVPPSIRMHACMHTHACLHACLPTRIH